MKKTEERVSELHIEQQESPNMDSREKITEELIN